MFVDRTGRRRRLTLIAGTAMGLGLLPSLGLILAADTGPGNALIDDWAHRHTGVPCDIDGALAEAGRPDAALLARLLSHPFFAALRHCVTRVRHAPTTFTSSTGFNDMHFFANLLKIATAGYGPGGRNEHGVDEAASIKELIATAKIYAGLLTTFGG